MARGAHAISVSVESKQAEIKCLPVDAAVSVMDRLSRNEFRKNACGWRPRLRVALFQSHRRRRLMIARKMCGRDGDEELVSPNCRQPIRIQLERGGGRARRLRGIRRRRCADRRY
jgi:hypothetical protein